MSKHVIHGINVKVDVRQGNITDQARGRCIGKVVNLCRDMPADEFVAAMTELRTNRFGGPRTAALLEQLDRELAANYTPRYSDDFAPIATVDIAEG